MNSNYRIVYQTSLHKTVTNGNQLAKTKSQKHWSRAYNGIRTGKWNVWNRWLLYNFTPVWFSLTKTKITRNEKMTIPLTKTKTKTKKYW